MHYAEESGEGTVCAVPSPEQYQIAKDDPDMPNPQSTKFGPAFQCYASDFLGSSKVARMSHTEIGMYWLLLCHAWLGPGLPKDIGEVSKMLKVPLRRFERVWAGVLGECWVERNGRLFNARQEQIRKAQIEFRQKQQVNGAKGGRPKGLGFSGLTQTKPTGKPKKSSSSPSSSSSSEKNVQEQEGSAVLTFATVGTPDSWRLGQERVTDWQQAYPNIDVLTQCTRAQKWLDANPVKRKTAVGMPRFLVNWLNNAVDRPRGLGLAPTGTDGRGRGRTGAPPPGKYDGIEES